MIVVLTQFLIFRDQTLYRNHVKNQGGIAEEKEQFVVPVGFAEDRPGFDFSVPLQGKIYVYSLRWGISSTSLVMEDSTQRMI